MRTSLRVAVSISAWLILLATPAASDITSASLQIQGISLEVETTSVTTGLDMPTTVQTLFGGKKNDQAAAVEGLLAVGDLSGPGIDAPIQLTTSPGQKFQIPGLSREGLYFLQNVRLMKGTEFVAPAAPSTAAITVANVLQTSVKVRQLTPEELRSRGIVVDGRNFDVYEYSFTFLVDGGAPVTIPFLVMIDPRTHEVIPIAKETPYGLPPVGAIQPPRWSPPDVITFDLPPDPVPDGRKLPTDPPDKGQRRNRPSIPAAIVIPNSLAVMHQFFAVILTVTNGAPVPSTARIDDIHATIKLPAALRYQRSNPSVSFGQPVPIVDPVNNVTFLVAQAKGQAEWDLEGLKPGTHTVEIEVRATFKEIGQEDVPLRATPRASIVVHDPRFNITFSHPDVVRKGIDYSMYSFVTNMTPSTQTIRVTNGVPSCDQVAGANVCRNSGADSDEMTLQSGEMRTVEYKLRPGITGNVFATAGTVDNDAIAAAVQLHMGVSESGIPLSPATLVLPHYARYVSPDLVSTNLQLLGLGYSLATAPVNQTTAKFPRVIKTDVYFRAADIARAGQRIFITDPSADGKRDAIADLALDLLGNSVELREWDQLRRSEKSGRAAGAAVIRELQTVGMAGRSVGELVDLLASATSYRNPFVLAISSAGSLSLKGTSGRRSAVANEADSGWIRDLPFADVSRFGAGEIALLGRWTEDVELRVDGSGPVSIDIVFPGATEGTAMRAHFDLNTTAGETMRIPITRGATNINALIPGGGFAATATASPVVPVALQISGARQDLHLDPEGHKVSVLFNRPVALPAGVDVLTKFAGRIAFNRDGVIYNGERPIFAAALQEDKRTIHLAFDHVLTTNATYTINVSPFLDPLSGATVPFTQPLVPVIDNNRPAGILFGKFLKGDNTPIPAAEVRLYTGHYVGCQAGILADEPPLDCNPYREAPQYAKTEADGSYLFEYVPRDPIADPGLSGGYRIFGVTPAGRATVVDGAVRLPGRVHFLNLQLLGRGSAEGVVRYENGSKVANARVFVGSTMFNIGKNGTTDGNGFFHVEDLPVGPITFSATDEAGNTTFASGEIATPGQLISKDLLIIRKQFPGVGSVSGVVRRSDTNALLAGVRVGVFTQGYGLAESFTDSDGKFEFQRVPAGFVTLLAADWTISRESAAIDFDLRADESKQVTLMLGVQGAAPLVSLSGDVSRENPLIAGAIEPVPGALVRIAGGPATTADSNGHFSFESIPLTFANRVIDAYDPSTHRVGEANIPTLSQSTANSVAILIRVNSYGKGTIRVRLINSRGDPVPGFRVLDPGFPPIVLREVGAGVYEYRDAPVGSLVNVWAVSGPPQYGDQYASGSAKIEFAGQVASMTLRLPGQGTVRAKLRSDFDLIGDVAIAYPAWDEAEQSLLQKSVTRSTSENGVAGFATFTGVPAFSAYLVDSTHPSFGYASHSGMLGYDGDLANHTLQLNRLATIRGTVYAIDGITPIAGAAIRLEDGRRDTGVSVTNPDGTFAFHDVPADVSFRVTSEATQSGIYRTGVGFGRTPPVGGPVDGVAVVMRRRGSVEGKVVYAGYKRFDPDNPANNIIDDTPADLSDNAPVPLAKLWLRELDFPNRSFGNDVDPLTADVNGRFAVSNVFVGSLRASAWDTGNQELRGNWTGTLEEEGQDITTAFIGVGGGGTGVIQVLVADPNQGFAGIANAEVGLFRGGLFDLTSTDGNGVARFHQVPVGPYTLSAYSKALGKSGTSSVFTVERDLVREVRVLLEFSGKVDGTLTDPESIPGGQALQGVPVTLTGVGFQTRSTTNLGGAFSFDGVREGLFTLEAKDTESNRRAVARRLLSAADPHPIVNLELERTETLHLAVYLPNDTGGNSGVHAGPVVIDVIQRCGAGYCDFFRTLQGNPIVMPKLLRDVGYKIFMREIGGERREFSFIGDFPKGSAADPFAVVYPAFGRVEVTVLQGGVPSNGARVSVAGANKSVTLFTDSTGIVIAEGIPLGDVSIQARSLDGGLSGSASLRLERQSVAARVTIELGAYAAFTGIVEAEAGGASVETRVAATFAGRVLETITDGDGRYNFQGVPTQASGTRVDLTYIGPDGITVGGRQTIFVGNESASHVVAIPTIRLDATPPQLVSITPDDGAATVSPDTLIRFLFSEPIRADQIHNGTFQLFPADGSGQVLCTFDAPVVNPNGTFVITMRPPPPPAGQQFPLKSNTLYRVVVSGAISDLTGHTLPAPRGITFTTSDYTEPRILKTIPAVTSPVPEQVTFQFIFNELINPSGATSFHFYKISAAGPAGTVIAEKPGNAFVDPGNGTILMFGPADPIEPESFYRIVFSGVRDLQGNVLPEQVFHYFSFDRTKPFLTLISPVPPALSLISGVEYLLSVETAPDVAFIDFMRVDGAAETYLTTITKAPFAYRFVAPEAPEAGIALTLRARATDTSGNVSDPATITWTVKPNAAPKNVAVTLTPASEYPSNNVSAGITFEDEGTFATAQVVLRATRNDGSEHTDSKTRQISRNTVSDPWPTTAIDFALPPNLRPATSATFTATVTDVRGLNASSSSSLSLLTDAVRPTFVTSAPAPETNYHLGEKFAIEATVSDAETAVAEVVFAIDGQTHHVSAASATLVAPKTWRFVSPQITVPAKNIDTRVPIVITAIDYQANSAQRTFDVVYLGVNDPALPKGAWQCPLDRAAVPAAQTNFTMRLRVRATDDIAVTSVKFRVPGIVDPITASQIGTTSDYEATVTFATPAAGTDLIIAAIISDADSTHTIELPITLDAVVIDQTIDATQAITAENIAQFANKSLLVRGAGRLVTHVPLTLTNLLVLDGGKVESLGTTTTREHRVDITVVDRMFVDCGCAVDVTGKGYLGGWGLNPDGSGTKNESATGRTIGNSTSGGAVNSSASHAGLGSAHPSGAANATYGSLFDPTDLGSGGAGSLVFCCTAGGAGGGAISLRTAMNDEARGRIVIAGSLLADGNGGFGAYRSGSGGSIRVNARQVIVGPLARISANGGSAAMEDGAGIGPAAGGGRIVLTASERLDLAAQLQARGGGTPATSYLEAGVGTILVRKPLQQYGELFITSYDVPDLSRPHITRATPIEGGQFDRIEIGPHALARFDGSFTVGAVTDVRAAATIDPSAVLLLASDRPIVSVVAIPVAGENLIRASTLALTMNASSLAGLRNASVQLSVAPNHVEPFAGFPTTVSGRAVSIAVPANATLGAATLNISAIDRADRIGTVPVASYNVVENQPPAITAFTTIPDNLYPGNSVTATVSATDDVAVTKVTLTSPVGAVIRTPNTKSTEQIFTIAIPITTPGGTTMNVEAAVEDNFPGRAAVTQTKTISILRDTVAPQLAITAPANNEVFDETSGAMFTVRANVTDAEVGVKSVTVRVGDGAPVALVSDGSPGGWRADVLVPNVDGVDIVNVPVVVTASDFESNLSTASIQIRVRPLIDPNAPSIAWNCGSSGGMYPVGFAAKLRVTATGSSTVNGVQRVEYFIDGSSTPIAATQVASTDFWDATYTIPSAPDLTIIRIRAIATSVSGNSADLSSQIAVIVPSIPAITSDLTIDTANAATYAHKAIIVQSGTVTVAVPLTLDRLAILGGKITQRNGGSEKLQVTTTGDLFVACDSSMDVTGAGFTGGQTYPGATPPGTNTAGSHIGVGGVATPPAATSFGSVYRPLEPGGGGENPNPSNGLPGGGVVRLAGATVTNEGIIRANGAVKDGFFGVRGGAGGSIWVTATNLGGRGIAEANGSASHDLRTGGGGALSIESGGTIAWQMSARAGTTAAGGTIGGAGSIYIKDGGATYGVLTIDNDARGTGAAVLPSLGGGLAQSGTSGATLITDRATDIPPYFIGHWVEIAGKGTWRIGSVSAKTATLAPNAGETIALAAGDAWQGVYHFDTVFAPNGDAFRSSDPVRLGANGLLSLQGPTAVGRFLDLPNGVTSGEVTIAGHVSTTSIDATNVTVKSAATLAPPMNNDTPEPLTINATAALTIESGAEIDATGRGYGGHRTYPGATLPGSGSAGSHIGFGALSNPPTGSTFGSIYRPQEAGGGGEHPHPDFGHPGGGIIRISGATVTNNGAIRANGAGRDGFFDVRSGAGGSIWIASASLAGTGVVEANGGSASHGNSGGGGAVSIETSTSIPWPLSATSGAGGGLGGAGTLYVKRNSSTYGDLTIDNAPATVSEFGAQATELPSLGIGVAQTGTTGATLVTDRATDIPPYFVGHYVDIAGKGLWRIGSVNSRTATLLPNASETISLVPGDWWRGAYRLDSLTLRTARVLIADRLLVTTAPDLDADSVILGNNAGAPVVNAALIALSASAVGSTVVGTAGAVLDSDLPVTIMVTNTTSGATFNALAANNGSFTLGVAGSVGDHLTLKARDGNYFPLESQTYDVGTITRGTPTATQIDKSGWDVDAGFKAQTIAINGTILALSSANILGSDSDQLVVLDTTNPASPVFVRTVATGLGPIRDIDVVDGWGYITGNQFGTIDLRNATSTVNTPANHGFGQRTAVVVRGSTAFVADFGVGRVLRYDVTNPAQPVFMDDFATSPWGAAVYTDLVAYGNDYLIGIGSTNPAGDVVVIDVRDINNSHINRRLADLDIPEFSAYRGSIRGSLLYLVSTSEPQLVVVDLATPSAPVIAARVTLPAPAGGLRVLQSIGLIASTTAGLVASNPDPPGFGVLGAAPILGTAYDVVVGSSVGYIANDIGVAVMPLSLPPQIDATRVSLSIDNTMVSVVGAALAITGEGAISAEVRNSATGASITVPVAANGSFATVLPGSSGNVITVKATDASGRVGGPLAVGTVPFGGDTILRPITIADDAGFRARGVKVEGSILAVAGYSPSSLESDKLVVFDLSTPAAPLQTRVVATGGAGIRDFEIVNGWAYIASDRLTTVDLRGTTPFTPNPNSFDAMQSIAVSGDHVFLASGGSFNGDVYVFDATNRSAPQFVSWTATAPGLSVQYNDLLVFGSNYLIGISATRDVTVIDRRDVNVLHTVGGLQIPAIAGFRGRIEGSLLYVAGQAGGVAIVDLGNPAVPMLVRTIDTPGLAYGIDVGGGSAVVADRTAGISFLDATHLIGTQPIPGDAWDVALGFGNLYIANDSGLAVIPNVLAPPRINTSLISIAADGTTTGQIGAITGRAPLTATVKNLTTLATITVSVNANGGFTAPLPSAVGQILTVSATDGAGRVAGPLVIGAVPFGPATRSISLALDEDPSFRARMLKAEGNLLAIGGWSSFNSGSNAVVTYDVANPAAPVRRNVLFAPGTVRDLELQGGWLFIGSDTFATVDLRSVDLTVNSADASGGQAIAVSGGYAFTANFSTEGSVSVIDVTNPAAPRYIESYATAPGESTMYSDLLILGSDYLVGISDVADVTVIDRRDAGNLRGVATLSIPQFTGFRGKIVGSTLYVAGLDGGVATVDLSIPTAPLLVSTASSAGLAYGVDVSGASVIVADKGAGVTLFDNATGVLQRVGTYGLMNNAWDVALVGSTLFVANESSLAIIDNAPVPPKVEASAIAITVTTPTTVTVTGTAAVSGRAPITVQVKNNKTAVTSGSVVANGSGSFTATVAARAGESLSVNATDTLGRSNSVPAGVVPFFRIVENQRGTADEEYNLFARRIAVGTSHAVVTNGTVYGQPTPAPAGGALLFRLPNASEPATLRTVIDAGVTEVLDIEVRGETAFFAGHRFSTLDLLAATPTAASDANDPCGREYAVAVFGTYAFTAEGDCSSNGTIHVYSLAAGTPLFVRSQAVGTASGVIYRDLISSPGGIVYAVTNDGTHDLTVIDVTDANNLALRAEFDIPNFAAFSAALDGTTLYLAGGDAGIAIVDVTNPSAPQLRSIINTPGVGRAVAVSRANEIVVADGATGLTFIDTTDRQNPILLGSQELPGNATDVKVTAGRIYAASETRFFVVVRP